MKQFRFQNNFGNTIRLEEDDFEAHLKWLLDWINVEEREGPLQRPRLLTEFDDSGSGTVVNNLNKIMRTHRTE
jgi:hypothetical protein